MKKTLEQELAERLVNIYMEKNVDAMTDVEKSIRQELEAREYFPKDRVYDRTDFFSKRIKKIEQSCERNEDDVDGKGRLLVPRPYMNLKKYTIENLSDFYRVYIEKTLATDETGKQYNRKIKYNLDKKINVDNDYQFVIDLLKVIDPQIQYPDIKNDNAEEIYQYNERRQMLRLYAKHSIDNVKDKISMNPLWSTVIMRVQKQDGNNKKRGLILMYMTQGLLNMSESIVSEESFKKDISELQNKYYVIWNLWIYVIMQTFQIFTVYISNSKEIYSTVIGKIVDMMNMLENHPVCATEPNLAQAYYIYNRLLKYRTNLVYEIVGYNVRCDDYIKIKKEDLFTENDELIKKKYTKEVLCEKFQSGTKSCKLETFNNRIQKCREFIPKYNEHASRNLNMDNYKTLRAVHRAIYINPIKYDRVKSPKIVEAILELPEKQDNALLSKHYILGSSISRELMMEEPNGEDVLMLKNDFMNIFYSLMLKILYNEYPVFTCSKEELRKKMELLNECMQKILIELFLAVF